MTWNSKMEQEDHNIAMSAAGSMTRQKGIRRAESLLEQSGRISRMILSARSAAQARMSSATLTESWARSKR